MSESTDRSDGLDASRLIGSTYTREAHVATEIGQPLHHLVIRRSRHLKFVLATFLECMKQHPGPLKESAYIRRPGGPIGALFPARHVKRPNPRDHRCDWVLPSYALPGLKTRPIHKGGDLQWLVGSPVRVPQVEVPHPAATQITPLRTATDNVSRRGSSPQLQAVDLWSIDRALGHPLNLPLYRQCRDAQGAGWCRASAATQSMTASTNAMR